MIHEGREIYMIFGGHGGLGVWFGKWRDITAAVSMNVTVF